MGAIIIKILITGAAGFIGASLTHKLLDNEIHILVKNKSNLWRLQDILNKIYLHEVDLFNYDDVFKIVSKIKPQIIFHLAAYGAYPKIQTDIKEMVNTNIIGTINLVKACSKVGFKSFVNTGTSSEYGFKDKPINENNLLEPNNYYGASKAAATLFCQILAKDENLNINTLRPFSVYGYYEEKTRLIPTIIMSCLKNEPLRLRNKESLHDFVFVEDVIDAYLKLSNSNLCGKIINIGSGKQFTNEEVVKKIMEISDISINVEYEHEGEDLKEPDFWEADITLAKNLLDWSPKHNLEKGLKKTFDWFKSNINLY